MPTDLNMQVNTRMISFCMLKKSKLGKHKDFYEEIGFKPKAEGFGKCVLKMLELNKD